MSDEDAFLSGIAADRADRTRLLVFADWLADRSDPREEFVRVHTRLLDMDGSEPEFAIQNNRWKGWVGGTPFDDPDPARLDERWLDAVCRVIPAADIAAHDPAETDRSFLEVARFEYDSSEHRDRSGGYTTIMYLGKPDDFRGPLDFVAQSVLPDLTGGFELGDRGPGLVPLTRGAFWRGWRMARGSLAAPPPLPRLAPDNLFLGAQYVGSGEGFVALVAVHRDDYFALFWSTTA